MPVDRSVIEVGAEEIFRLLLSRTNEDVSAEAQDGLIGTAVPIGFIAVAVEVHHLSGVFLVPEDVVVEEAIAIIGSLFGNLRGADGAVPDKGRDTVERRRCGGEALERGTELSLPGDDGLTPEAAQQVIVLHREWDALADVLAKPRVDRTGVTAAQHQVDAPVGEVLEKGVVLREADGVVGSDQRGGSGELKALCLRRDIGQVSGGCRWDERWVVVLAGGENVEAYLLRFEGDLRYRADALCLGGVQPVVGSCVTSPMLKTPNCMPISYL